MFADPAATEHEKANAKELKGRLERQLGEEARPEGAWTGIMFRLGAGCQRDDIAALSKSRLDGPCLSAWQNVPQRFQEVAVRIRGQPWCSSSYATHYGYFACATIDRPGGSFRTSLFVPAISNICGMTVMSDFEDRPPPAVGAYWIKEEDYPALLKLSDDGNKMPRTWKEWLKMAEEMERDSRPTDMSSCVFISTPNTFPEWCAAHGTSPGREGRKRFVAAAMAERYGDQN